MIAKILELTKKPITLAELSKETGYSEDVLKDIISKMQRDGLIQMFSAGTVACSAENSYCAQCPLKNVCSKKDAK